MSNLTNYIDGRTQLYVIGFIVLIVGVALFNIGSLIYKWVKKK